MHTPSLQASPGKEFLFGVVPFLEKIRHVSSSSSSDSCDRKLLASLGWLISLCILLLLARTTLSFVCFTNGFSLDGLPSPWR